jgi:DNA polymerase III alpha subunit
MTHSFQNAGFDLKHPRIAKYLELCMRIQDLPRHLGQHSGGMVICQAQLNSIVPLERASMPGRTVVQWDKEDCADLHIIQVDLLHRSFGTILKANGEDMKTVQELLRHANSRITLDVYTQATTTNKRAAQSRIVKMMVIDAARLAGRS